MMKEPIWEWYCSRDGERFDGPCDSREAAIQQGQQDYDGEAFQVAEATTGTLRAFIDVHVSEWLDEANEESSDPEGDPISSYVTGDISSYVTGDQWKDLFKRFDAVALEWAKDHDLNSYVWIFDAIRNREDIPGTIEPKAKPNA